MEMNMAELMELCEKLKLKVPVGTGIDLVRAQIIRLLDCNNNLMHSNVWDSQHNDTNLVQNNRTQPLPSDKVSTREKGLLAKIESLKSEVKHLQTDLSKSESLRKNMALSLERLQGHQSINSVMKEVVSMNSTRWIKDESDSNMGLLWNLENKSECFRSLDTELMKLNHASRCSGEHPMVIMSSRPLEVASFPVEEQVASSWAKLNEALKVKTNMVAHVCSTRGG